MYPMRSHAQSPSMLHSGQARSGHAAPQAPGLAGPRGKPRGITISSHISKLEPTAFYALATAIYKRALGGLCLVGGMRGVSLQEVVRMVHMKLDLARLRCRVVDVLITDLAKFFDVIAQDVHPIVGAHVGLGRLATWLPTRRASRMPCP